MQPFTKHYATPGQPWHALQRRLAEKLDHRDRDPGRVEPRCATWLARARTVSRAQPRG